MDGLSFVAETRQRLHVAGLRIEVQKVFGREGLVAFNERYGGGGC